MADVRKCCAILRERWPLLLQAAAKQGRYWTAKQNMIIGEPNSYMAEGLPFRLVKCE